MLDRASWAYATSRKSEIPFALSLPAGRLVHQVLVPVGPKPLHV
jgi:hypothetical protein